MAKIIDLSFSPEEYTLLPDKPDKQEKDFGPSVSKVLKSGKHITDNDYRIVKKSIDARRKSQLKICIKIELLRHQDNINNIVPDDDKLVDIRNVIKKSPVIVGFGPAGIFAALYLAQKGLEPIVIERGFEVEKRVVDVNNHMRGQPINPSSNIQFGEGGAGTFSDGKLYSGISDYRRSLILNMLVEYGAPSEILYLNNPHVGTDRLRIIIPKIRDEIIRLGGRFMFGRKVVSINKNKSLLSSIVHVCSVSGEDEQVIECSHLILAIGHSARDTFKTLRESGIDIQAKPFAVGLRIEHLQSWINQAQFGPYSTHPALGAADYRLVSHHKPFRSAYTFCMCPGGYVIAASDTPGQVVTNGMSCYLRDSVNSNAAILVGVSLADFDSNDALAGMYFQERLEKSAFELGGSNGYAPVQRVEDFINDVESTRFGEVEPSFLPGVTFSNLKDLFPNVIYEGLRDGIIQMGTKLRGFSHPDAILTAVETRTSSPVRIIRDESLHSPSCKGLYPCGEGAGYAGGIMSSAVDGLRCAEQLFHDSL
ncbi:MAG: hypothetical protein GXY06_01985 [Clostridiaceae bacterium]|nr:hypothetical protein [Clostridiaceae bacterium]